MRATKEKDMRDACADTRHFPAPALYLPAPLRYMSCTFSVLTPLCITHGIFLHPHAPPTCTHCWNNGALARKNEREVYCGLGEGCGQTREGARV